MAEEKTLRCVYEAISVVCTILTILHPPVTATVAPGSGVSLFQVVVGSRSTIPRNGSTEFLGRKPTHF